MCLNIFVGQLAGAAHSPASDVTRAGRNISRHIRLPIVSHVSVGAKDHEVIYDKGRTGLMAIAPNDDFIAAL